MVDEKYFLSNSDTGREGCFLIRIFGIIFLNVINYLVGNSDYSTAFHIFHFPCLAGRQASNISHLKSFL